MADSGLRYAVVIPTEADQALEWCRQQFGEAGFFKRWIVLDYTIQFKFEADRNWFLLRWS